MKKNKLKAFSLNELLVVMVIVGILAAIAIPKFTQFTAEAYSTEAPGQLNHIKMLQERNHRKKFTYSLEFEEINFEAPKKKPEGTSVYDYEMIEATKTTFICKATAINDYDGDGIKEEITINQEGVIETILKD